MTSLAKMQFFTKILRCDEVGCGAQVVMQVTGPENADYHFCGPHGEAFRAQARTWEAYDEGRRRGERFKGAERRDFVYGRRA